MRPTDRLYRRGMLLFSEMRKENSPAASLTSPATSFSSIAPRPRGSSARGATFLRQEKSSAKECFPQGRASRAFAADFGELRINKNQCFEFAEPRALQAPLASPPLSCERWKALASLSLRMLPPEFSQMYGEWVETQKSHKLHAFNGSARDESLAANVASRI